MRHIGIAPLAVACVVLASCAAVPDLTFEPPSDAAVDAVSDASDASAPADAGTDTATSADATDAADGSDGACLATDEKCTSPSDCCSHDCQKMTCQ